MIKWIERVFKEYMPVKDAMYNDQVLIWTHTIGGLLITFTFCAIGILCLLLGKQSIEKNTAYAKRLIMTRLFGLFLIACGISRGVDVLCIWVHLAYLAAYVKMFTGIASLFALLYIPTVRQAIKEAKTVEQVSATMTETNKKIDKLTELSQKVVEGK